MPIIKRWVTEKLLADQYYVSLDEIKENTALQPTVRMKTGVTLDSLLSVHDCLQQENEQLIRQSFSENVNVLVCYSELLLNHIQCNHTILYKIPRWLKADTRFLDGAITRLDALLCDAIETGNQDNIESLTTSLLHLMGDDQGYLPVLSKPILENLCVAKKLLEKNVLWFGYLDDALQNNAELLAFPGLMATLTTGVCEPADSITKCSRITIKTNPV